MSYHQVADLFRTILALFHYPAVDVLQEAYSPHRCTLLCFWKIFKHLLFVILMVIVWLDEIDARWEEFCRLVFWLLLEHLLKITAIFYILQIRQWTLCEPLCVHDFTCHVFNLDILQTKS